MESKFRLYSTDVDPTVDPDSESPAPATLIVFDQDPLFADYNPDAGEQDRGSVIRTLGGTVVQDFGIVDSDGLITMSDTNALSGPTVAAIRAAQAVVDGRYYFTDGYECWLVQFSRNPRGFVAYRNILVAYHGVILYSYDMSLIVVSKEI